MYDLSEGSSLGINQPASRSTAATESAKNSMVKTEGFQVYQFRENIALLRNVFLNVLSTDTKSGFFCCFFPQKKDVLRD